MPSSISRAEVIACSMQRARSSKPPVSQPSAGQRSGADGSPDSTQ